MNSAYSIFKRPALIDKGQPFLEVVLGFQAQVHYTPNLAQETNLSRNQRQLIVDRSSFDGAVNRQCVGTRQLSRRNAVVDCPHICVVGHSDSRLSSTFKATSNGRRINVDRVSIRKGAAWKADTLRPHKERLDLFDGCSLVTVKSKRPLHRKPNTHRVAISGLETRQVRGPCGDGSTSLCSDRPPFTNADSYSQCFRQFDCILGLNKAITASLGAEEFAPCPVGVCRIDWVAQLTQTKQGGCLYEQPVVRYWRSGENSKHARDLHCSGSFVPKILSSYHSSIQRLTGANPVSATIWQKPGIGIHKSSKCNQTQALTTPVNLVGGAVTCEPYLPLVGPKPPYKGGSYGK